MVADKQTNLKIGVGVLVWRGQQLLLGQRIAKDQSTCWQFPGGHLEQGESVIECALREVSEETGLTVKNLRHFGFTDKTFRAGGHQYITLLVSCEYVDGVARTLEPEKCNVWQWFDSQKLPEPLFKPIQIFLAQQPESLLTLHKNSTVISPAPFTV
jgi:8-oxo-dGTP diphosphatase